MRSFFSRAQRKAFFVHARHRTLTDAWRASLEWNRTLMVLSSDNGGPIQFGANNYPLRGGKYTNWCVAAHTRGLGRGGGGVSPVA